MKAIYPVWNITEDIADFIDSDDEIWESDVWSPILLSVMKGTVYKGREIALAWQIEFEPFGVAFEQGRKRLEAFWLDDNGYGWAEMVAARVRRLYTDVADNLHFGDTEEESCVVWVESEAQCRILMEVTWALIHDSV